MRADVGSVGSYVRVVVVRSLVAASADVVVRSPFEGLSHRDAFAPGLYEFCELYRAACVCGFRCGLSKGAAVVSSFHGAVFLDFVDQSH